MNRRNFIITLIALAAMAGATFSTYRYERRAETAATCPFCERMVHSVSAYRLKVDGHEVTACCPRCGMHAQLNGEQGNKGNATATDVMTGERIAADSATYVEGGDVEYCTHGQHPVTREPNSVSVREYDRCLPTLAAFKNHEEAELYQKQHGGRVLSYAEALGSVRK